MQKRGLWWRVGFAVLGKFERTQGKGQYHLFNARMSFSDFCWLLSWMWWGRVCWGSLAGLLSWSNLRSSVMLVKRLFEPSSVTVKLALNRLPSSCVLMRMAEDFNLLSSKSGEDTQEIDFLSPCLWPHPWSYVTVGAGIIKVALPLQQWWPSLYFVWYFLSKL